VQLETEQYQGLERDQSFVRKFDDRLFSFCRTKHRERWAGKRRVPVGVYHEGEEGWWFPTVWVADFTDRFGTDLRTRVWAGDTDARIAAVNRVVAALGGRRAA
jgi:hypothetical protein